MLSFRSLLSVLLGLCLSTVVAAAPAPAEQVFRQWLAAYNAGNGDALQAFADRYQPGRNAQRDLGIRDDFGRFQLMEVRAATARSVEVILLPEANDRALLATVILEADDGARIEKFQIEGVETPAAYKPVRLPIETVLAQARTRLDAAVAADTLSGAVLVARNGQILMQWHGGAADRERALPVTADTRFRLASLNKMFTAVAVLQLVDAGQLALEAPIGRYLPDYPHPAVAQTVSVRQLLNHTSGLGDVFGEEFEARSASLQQLADYPPVFAATAPTSTPGTEDGYSNYGYILLGLIVEAVSGQSYYDYVAEHIHRVAGMEATGSEPESSVVPGRAVAYSKVDGQWQRETRSLPWRGTSAGGGYSTTGDMLRFAEALRSGKLLSAQSLQAATHAQNHKAWYGYGFMVAGDGRERRYGHEGGAPGANTALVVMPDPGYVVIGLGNVDPGAMENQVNFIANRLPL